MRDVILARNALDPTCWVSHKDVANLTEFLQENVGPKLPPHTRFYQGAVDGVSDVTPFDLPSTEAMESLPGPLYVVCYPEDPGTLAVSATIFVFSVILGQILKKDKKDPNRPPRQGSANNALSDRQNSFRLLGRINDIYGKVRATPDLIAQPYITYDQNLEVEIAVMALGRGTYDVVPSDVFEGDSPAQIVQGLSVEVYPPFNLPTIGSPQITIGTAINTPVQTVFKVEAVNGQVMAAMNANTLHGTIPIPDNNASNFAAYAYMWFSADAGSTPAFGYINVPYNGDPAEVTDALNVGDVLELRYSERTETVAPGGPPSHPVFLSGLAHSGVGGHPNLNDDNLGYTVVSLTPFSHTYSVEFAVSVTIKYVEVKVAIPTAKRTQWGAIVTFGGVATGYYNPRALLTPKKRASGNYKNEIGPFFVNDPNMQSLSLNFVADRGLFTDDGKNVVAFNVDIDVLVAPADSTGSAIGAFEEQIFTVTGNQFDLTTRAVTVIFTPGSFAGGRCLVSCLRITQTPWRVEDLGQSGTEPDPGGPSIFLGPANPPGDTFYPASEWNPTGYVDPNGGDPHAPGIYRPITGTVEDEVRWTHLYSISDPGVSDFGDVSLVMAKTVQQRGTRNAQNTRKLSMLCTRKTNLWNGSAFVGPLQSNLLGRDTFFAILKDPLLGNIPDAQIDFPGIAAAFGAVDAYFGDFATNFGATFDSESSTLEDMLARVAQSCFCTAYREGGIIKVKPKIAVDNAIVLFNHRNMLPGSETRTVAFGTEADYDGAKIDYADDAGNTIKTLIVPAPQDSSRPLEVSVTGIRDSVRAAFHAWRAYNHILYQNTRVEFNALAEAALCVIDDKILVADTTRPETLAGEIVGVSGLFLTTSQDIPSGATVYTAFLQHTDGTVEGIPAAFLETRQIALFSAPSVPLVTDPGAGVRTGYTLVAPTDARSRGFLLEQKSAQSTMTWQLAATNYSAGYYFQDALQTWFNPRLAGLLDLSPYSRTFAITGSFPTVIDGTRGAVVSDDSTAFVTVSNPDIAKLDVANYTSYTKSLWLNKTAPGTSQLISPASGSGQDRLIWDSSEHITIDHNNVTYIDYPGMPAATWVMVTATYNAVTHVLRLYINGASVAFQSSVPAASSHAGLKLLAGWSGLVDDCRMYLRCLSPEDVNELFLRTFM